MVKEESGKPPWVHLSWSQWVNDSCEKAERTTCVVCVCVFSSKFQLHLLCFFANKKGVWIPWNHPLSYWYTAHRKLKKSTKMSTHPLFQHKRYISYWVCMYHLPYIYQPLSLFLPLQTRAEDFEPIFKKAFQGQHLIKILACQMLGPWWFAKVPGRKGAAGSWTTEGCNSKKKRWQIYDLPWWLTLRSSDAKTGQFSKPDVCFSAIFGGRIFFCFF